GIQNHVRIAALDSGSPLRGVRNDSHCYFLKSRNTVSGALVLWRDGTVRPAQTSTAPACLKSRIGAVSQRGAPLSRQPRCATSLLISVTNIDRSAANGPSL